jgi:hypothetical protein
VFKDMALVHDWENWKLYEFVRPIDEDERFQGANEITVTHQRRHCKNCNKVDDEFLRYGSIGSLPAPGKAKRKSSSKE